MAVKPKPDGYHTVTPYLMVPGAAKMIEFLRQAFGAEERQRHNGPGDMIMHAEVQLGDSVIMLADANADFPARGSAIHLYVDDVDAMYKRALGAGATSEREPADQVYGDRSAGVVDAFGNQWWLATHVEDVSPEEMERRMSAGTPA